MPTAAEQPGRREPQTTGRRQHQEFKPHCATLLAHTPGYLPLTWLSRVVNRRGGLTAAFMLGGGKPRTSRDARFRMEGGL